MNNSKARESAVNMPLDGQAGGRGLPLGNGHGIVPKQGNSLPAENAYGSSSAHNYSISAEDESALFEQFMQNAPQGGMDSLEELDMEKEIRTLMDMGLGEPDRKVLGAGYFTLRTLGVAPLAAYKIMENDLERTKEALLSPPPRAGRVNSKTREPKSFYTPEEVDRLRDEDLNDPKILEDVMKSMTKWNR